MGRLFKNAKELHYDHQKWLSELSEFRIEVITLAKHNKGKFKKDTGFLLRSIGNLVKTIHKHEETIALAFKTAGIDDHTEVFANHEDIRRNMDNLRFKLENLKALFVKYNNFKSGSKKQIDSSHF